MALWLLIISTSCHKWSVLYVQEKISCIELKTYTTFSMWLHCESHVGITCCEASSTKNKLQADRSGPLTLFSQTGRLLRFSVGHRYSKPSTLDFSGCLNLVLLTHSAAPHSFRWMWPMECTVRKVKWLFSTFEWSVKVKQWKGRWHERMQPCTVPVSDHAVVVLCLTQCHFVAIS